MNKKIVAFVEMFLLVCMSFSVSYLLDENNKDSKIINSINLYESIISILLNDKNLVSAVADQGIATCVQSTTGAICQQSTAAGCAAMCGGSCINAAVGQVSSCNIGTCYDPVEGTCQARSPQGACVSLGGEWYADQFENIAQCKEGCCVLGSQVAFVSEQTCARQSLHAGLPKEFHAEILNEVACLGLASSLEIGACVFDNGLDKNPCSFVTKSECSSSGGSFYSGYLCSHPDLNTSCERQFSNSCIEGKDEVYWFDSCGNRENIYDSNKVKSWNGGKVLSDEESCSNPGEDCGNCDYLTGTICADRGNETDFVDIGTGEPIIRGNRTGTLDAYCRNLNCAGEEGSAKHGESWCVYQSSIGVDEDRDVSTDVPGSLHFRRACVDGEIKTEPCGDYRNDICVQNSAGGAGTGGYREAACRPNRWQECLDTNSLIGSGGEEGAAPDFSKMEKACEAISDCFVKTVEISDKLNFKYCAPRYPEGFDYETGSGGESICSQASQECDVIYVKGLSGWSCKENCECEEAPFANELHDLCISLGDCGSKFNLAGKMTENYNVVNTPEVDNIDSLKKYIKPVEGQFALPGDYLIPDQPVGYGGVLARDGVAGASGTGAAGSGATGSASGNFGENTAGASGSSGLASRGLAAGAGTAAIALLFKATGGKPSNAGAIAGAVAGVAGAIAMGATALAGGGGGAAGAGGAGASAGAAGAGASGGAAGGTAAGGAAILGAIAAVFTVIAILAAIVALVILLSGYGEIKIVKVIFQCYPWMPPSGGADCEKCGITEGVPGELPCSKYACSALGATCMFINEGTEEAECIDSGVEDANSPSISPNQAVLTEGNSYETLPNGVRIIGSENGCIKGLSPLRFGITLDEPGQCKFDIRHTDTFDEMAFYFGGRNLYLTEHSMTITVPTLESLGISNAGPEARTDYNLYVRCRDAKGNTNIKEYAINFCVAPTDDITPPIIVDREGSEYIAFNATTAKGVIYTNEPAECKWSIADKEYDAMENSLDCENDFQDQTLKGWMCSYTFQVPGNSSKFYIRCKDQPFKADDTLRNKATKSYELEFTRVSSPLTIDFIYPDNETLTYGVSPASVDIEVRTSGGIDGTAVCQFENNGQYINFFETFDRVHKQQLQFASGNQTLLVKCDDFIGDSVTRKATFSLELDRLPPLITRVYNQNGELNVITNEPSSCYYNLNTCNFEFGNGTLMSGSDLVHSTEFDDKLTYNVRCKDKFDNAPGTCTLMVTGAK